MLRRLALCAVVAFISLLLPWSSGPANALVPNPIPPVVTTKGGQLLVYYGLPAGVAAEPLTLVGAGVGAYQATCMVLEWTTPGDTTCDIQAAWHVVTTGDWAGGNIATYTGPASTIGHDAYVKPPGTVEVRTFAGQVGGGAFFSDRWTFRYLSGSTWAAAPCTIDFNRGGTLNGRTVTVPNGNSPAAVVAAYNATYDQHHASSVPSNYSGGCGLTGVTWGLEKVQVREVTGGSNIPVADWVTGWGPTAPHTLTVTETCTRPDGSTFQVSGNVTFTPTGPGQASPAVPLANCWDIAPGSVRTHVGTEVTRQGGASVQQTSQDTVNPLYPDCKLTMCELTPKYMPSGVRCFSGPTDTVPAEDCTDLWPESTDQKRDWQCWYGPYRVALDECLEAYPPTYFDPRVTPTPGPNPSPSPSTPPGPTAPPIPTTGANPEAPPEGNPEGDPQGSGCWGSGWSWNPISWVYVPVKCTMIWAFIPPAVPSFTDIASPIPAGWWPTIPSMSDSGCGPVTIGSLNLGSLLPATGSRELVNTCDHPWPVVRNFVYYGVLTMVTLAAGWRALGILTNGLGLAVNVAAAEDKYQMQQERRSRS